MNVRIVLLALLGVLALGLVAEPVFADEPKEEPGAEAKEEAGKGMSFSELDNLFEGSQGAFWFMLVSRYGALLIGLILLVLAYLRYDKIKGGLIPAAVPNPPPLLFDPGTSVLLAVGGAFLLPFLISVIAAQAMGINEFTASTMAQIIVMGVSTLPVAMIVTLRRYRLSGDAVPRWPKALGVGLSAFCIATVFVVPLTFLTILVMEKMGQSAPVQELVQETVTSPSHSLPIAIALYGVLIAPFAEEAIFRGLLYPAVKRWLGDTRQAAISSAVLVSLIFAAIHLSWTAAPGLFALALVLTYVYEKTNSLAAIVIAHATNNFLSLVPLLLARFS